ncbi:hypothetical protein D030_4092A, partial [Vibrio parahaemolyticus AQ3810]
MSRFKIFE